MQQRALDSEPGWLPVFCSIEVLKREQRSRRVVKVPLRPTKAG